MHNTLSGHIIVYVLSSPVPISSWGSVRCGTLCDWIYQYSVHCFFSLTAHT